MNTMNMISRVARFANSIFATMTTGLLLAGCVVGPAYAQGLPGEGDIRYNTPINAATDVRWDQKLDNKIDLTTTFRDELGRNVPIGSYFGNRPVILVMPFYRCPGMCTQELNGMVDVFKDEKLKYRVGRDFDVVTVSINPKEGPDLASMKKREYLDTLSQPGAENGWHFLTGTEASIKKLADDIGFRYKYNPVNDQYAHPTGIPILTPKGQISRYLFGVAYNPKDLRLALTEAGQGRIGSVSDKFVLACYHYDPQTGRYGLQIFRLMQILGFTTVFTLGGFMFLALRKDIGAPKLTRAGLKQMAAERAETMGTADSGTSTSPAPTASDRDLEG